IEIFRVISSSSQSVVVLPSAIFPQRGVMPAVKSNDDTSWVLPVPPWPTMPTFLMSLVRYVFIQTSQSAPLVACRRGPSCQWQARACAWCELCAGEGERGRLLYGGKSPQRNLRRLAGV